MGRHSDSSSSDSSSDSDDSSRKRARKADSADKSSSKSSKSSKKDRDSKRDSSSSKHHKSSKSDKDSKKHRKKESKSHKKSSSSKHSKKDRKRRRSHSRGSSTDGSDSDDSAQPRSSKAAASASTAAASSSAASAAAAASKSSIPLPSASSVSRCLDLIETLLKHGGGDRAESLRQVQFLLFKLDSGSSVDVSGLPDPLVKHILSTMLREAGCKVRQDPVSGEQGWMSPWDIKRARPAYKLLDVLGAAFAPAKAKATAEIGPTMPAPSPAASAAASRPVGPSLPASASAAAAAASSSDATVDAAPRVLGPAMPRAEDFDRLADPDAAVAGADDDDGGDAGSFGPKMPSQMSAAELVAFDRLRASREHLSMVKDMESARGGRVDGAGREEWMTALPTADSGMPSTALLAAMAASGDKEAMRGRGFATKAVTKADQDTAWAMSPAERARKDAEKVAVRQAEQAVYDSTRAINGQMSDLLGGGGSRSSANSTAEAAQAANDRMMARYKQQQASASDSLMAAHARASEAAVKSAKDSASGLFVWDREKEMGMRAVKGAVALKKEMQSAFTLGDNFAPAGS